jgi:23S rRNA-intervening sequence protein
MTIESYRDLVVWQKSMDLAELGYRITTPFPAEERYGMVSQIRRAVCPFRQILPKDTGAKVPVLTCNSYA